MLFDTMSPYASERPSPSIIRFVIVGAVGFAIDGGMLLLLLEQGYNTVVSRLMSFALAVTATWALNRIWTFAATKRQNKRREYLGYVATQTIGAAINLGVFFSYLALFPAQRQYPLLALLVGAVPALLFNFTASRYLVFVRD